MIEHCYSVGCKAPDLLNIVVEIPATDKMARKLEVDLSDGRVIDVGEIYPPISIYWHYGCIPQTLDDEGEALDVIGQGEEIEVRPIGVAMITDGWETRNGYRLKDIVEQFDAKPAEIKALFNNTLDPARAAALQEKMLRAGLPI